MFSLRLSATTARRHSPAIAFRSSRQSLPDVLAGLGAADESGNLAETMQAVNSCFVASSFRLKATPNFFFAAFFSIMISQSQPASRAEVEGRSGLDGCYGPLSFAHFYPPLYFATKLTYHDAPVPNARRRPFTSCPGLSFYNFVRRFHR